MPSDPAVSRINAWAAGHRRRLGGAAAVAAVALAVLWGFVVPEKVDTVSGMSRVAIRWGHSLCWALVSLAALSYALDRGTRWRTLLLWGAAACYVGFMVALI